MCWNRTHVLLRALSVDKALLKRRWLRSSFNSYMWLNISCTYTLLYGDWWSNDTSHRYQFSHSYTQQTIEATYIIYIYAILICEWNNSLMKIFMCININHTYEYTNVYHNTNYVQYCLQNYPHKSYIISMVASQPIDLILRNVEAHSITTASIVLKWQDFPNGYAFEWPLLQTAITLTHWGRVTHICVSKLSILGSDNGLSPGRRQAIF